MGDLFGTIFSFNDGSNQLFRPMQHQSHTSGPPGYDTREIVEVRLWGLYLLFNRTALYEQIVESSLDHGPVEKNPQSPGRITFRFSATLWEKKVKKLLYMHRIPVMMKSPMPLLTSWTGLTA